MKFEELNFIEIRKNIGSYFGERHVRRGTVMASRRNLSGTGYDEIEQVLYGRIGNYAVKIYLNSNNSVNATVCSCPEGRDCLHAAAFLIGSCRLNYPRIKGGTPDKDKASKPSSFVNSEQLPVVETPELLNLIRSQSKTITKAPPEPTVEEEMLKAHRLQDSLNKQMCKSLKLLVQESEEIIRPRTSPPTDQLIYILRYDDQARLLISPMSTYQLVTGGIAANYPVTFTEILYKSIQIVNPDDTMIATVWNLSNGASNLAGSKQETLLTDLLLQLIVETGRSVFQNLNNPTLHLGPEKQGKLAWIKDNQDRSALRFAIDDCGANENIAVLSAVSPWYIDQNTWQAGPLRTASPIGLVKQVLKTPAFTQSQLTYVQVWLEENAPYSIPYPLPGVQTEVQIVKPIVSLRFETISGSAVSFRKGKSDLAIVEVEYPGLPFNEEGEGIDMVTRVGNKIVAQKPDIAAFRKMIDEFEAWGFHKVDSENQLDHGTFLYSPDNRRSLQRFLSEATEDFRNRGWEIQIDKSFRHSISLDLSQLNVKVRNLDKWRFSLTLSSTTA